MEWSIKDAYTKNLWLPVFLTFVYSAIIWNEGVRREYFNELEGLQKIVMYGLLKLIIFVVIVLTMYVVLWAINKKNKRISVVMYIGEALFDYAMILVLESLSILLLIWLNIGGTLSEMFTWSITISTLIFVVLFALRTKRGIKWENCSYFKRKIRFKNI